VFSIFEGDSFMPAMIENKRGVGKVYDGERLIAENVEYDYQLHRSSPHKGLPVLHTVLLKVGKLPRPRPPRLTLHMSDGRKIDFDASGPGCKALGVPYPDQP
jgi:hypothetical protein